MPEVEDCALRASMWFGLRKEKEKHTFPVDLEKGREACLMTGSEVKGFFAYSCSFISSIVTSSPSRNTWEVLKLDLHALSCLQLLHNWDGTVELGTLV